MESMYDEIIQFMKDYVKAYSEYGQIAETHQVMDNFYAPELSFDEMVTNRDQWYQACLAHPEIQDKLTINHLFIDERQNEVGALLTTQAIKRETGEVLLELRMNVLYNLKIGDDRDIKITKARVFLETNPEKVARLTQLYSIGV